jgi:hypothetical protein
MDAVTSPQNRIYCSGNIRLYQDETGQMFQRQFCCANVNRVLPKNPTNRTKKGIYKKPKSLSQQWCQSIKLPFSQCVSRAASPIQKGVCDERVCVFACFARATVCAVSSPKGGIRNLAAVQPNVPTGIANETKRKHKKLGHQVVMQGLLLQDRSGHI